MFIINSSSINFKLVILGVVTASLFSGLMLCIDLSGSFSAACHFHSDFMEPLLWGSAISGSFFILFCILKTSQSVKSRKKKVIQKITDKFFPSGDILPASSHHGFSLLPSPLKRIVFDYSCFGYPEFLYCCEEFGLSKGEIKKFFEEIPTYFELSKNEFIEGVKWLVKISQQVPTKIAPSRKRNTDFLNHILYEWYQLPLDKKYQIFCWISYNKRKWCPKNQKGDYQKTHCLSVAMMLLLPFKRADETPFFNKSQIGDKKIKNNSKGGFTRIDHTDIHPLDLIDFGDKRLIPFDGIKLMGSVQEISLMRDMLDQSSASKVLFFRYLPKDRFSEITSAATFSLFFKEETAIELVRRKIISWERYYRHVCILGWNSTLTTILKADPAIVKEIVAFKDPKQRTLLHSAIIARRMQGFGGFDFLFSRYLRDPSWEIYAVPYYGPYMKIIRQANYIKTIQLLIEAGASLHCLDSERMSPRALAMQWGFQNILDLDNRKPPSDQPLSPDLKKKKPTTVSKNDLSNTNCFSQPIIRPLSIHEISMP